jgi:hypothetical protein
MDLDYFDLINLFKLNGFDITKFFNQNCLTKIFFLLRSQKSIYNLSGLPNRFGKLSGLYLKRIYSFYFKFWS